MTPELVQLEREVLESAKRWSVSILNGAHAQIAADNELRDALERLAERERNQPATTSA